MPNDRSRKRIGTVVLLGTMILIVASCSSAGSGSSAGDTSGGSGEETITWEVTGQVTGTQEPNNRFSIVWRIDYPNGGHEEISVSTLADDIPPWTKEEILDPGSGVSLSISPIPDTVDPQETFTLDLELVLYSNGTVVASDTVNETISPSDSTANLPDPPISYAIGN